MRKALWKRYFLKEATKLLLLFLASFYLLYVLIDYSSHAKAFSQGGLSFLKIFAYYLFQFTKRAEILLPLALLIATIKVLSTSNLRGEITALATGGLSLKKLLSPFLYVALFCALFCIANTQFIIPSSLTMIDRFEETYFHRNKERNKEVNELLLEDNSLLIYQSYDPATRALFDVFWLRSNDRIEKCKYLNPYTNPPTAQFIDHLAKNEKGEFIKVGSDKTLPLPEMRFKGNLSQAILPVESQSLSMLIAKIGFKSLAFKKMTNKEAKAATAFYYKLFMPLTCFLAVLAPASFLLRFGRHLPVFRIFAFSLCGFVIFITLMGALRILGESQVFPPFIAMLFPSLLFFTIAFARLARI